MQKPNMPLITTIWSAASEMASIQPAMMAEPEKAAVSKVICIDTGKPVSRTLRDMPPLRLSAKPSR